MSAAMTFSYDAAADAGYLHLDDTSIGIDYTAEIVPGVLADVRDDRVVGVEFIGVENLREWFMAAVCLRQITVNVSQVTMSDVGFPVERRLWDWYGTASPDVVLDLLDRLRAAEGEVERLWTHAVCDERWRTERDDARAAHARLVERLTALCDEARNLPDDDINKYLVFEDEIRAAIPDPEVTP